MLPFDAFSAAAAAAESSNQSQTDKQTDKLMAMTKREYYDSKRWLMFEQQKYRWEKVGNQQTDRQTQTQTQTSNWANITITQTVFFFFFSFLSLTIKGQSLSILSHFWCHHFYFFFLFTEHCCCLLCTVALFFFSWVDDLIFSFLSVVQSSPLTSLWPACVFYLTDGNAAGFLLKLSLSL